MTYTKDLAGSLTPLDPQALVQQISAPVDPRQQVGAPGQPGGGSVTQPSETLGGSDGSMITSSPSDSGSGQMIAGAGTP